MQCLCLHKTNFTFYMHTLNKLSYYYGIVIFVFFIDVWTPASLNVNKIHKNKIHLYYRNEFYFCGFYWCVNSVESLTNWVKPKGFFGFTQFVSDLPEFTHR